MASLFAEASVFSQAMDTVGHITVTTDVNRMKMTEALVHTLQQQVSKFVVCFTPEVPQTVTDIGRRSRIHALTPKPNSTREGSSLQKYASDFHARLYSSWLGAQPAAL